MHHAAPAVIPRRRRNSNPSLTIGGIQTPRGENQQNLVVSGPPENLVDGYLKQIPQALTLNLTLTLTLTPTLILARTPTLTLTITLTLILTLTLTLTPTLTLTCAAASWSR